MEGTIRTFLPTKGYGFVRGDDGLDYFLHEQNMDDGQVPQPGMRVAFDESATPRGYRARRVRSLVATPCDHYLTPPRIIETKGSEIGDWEVLESAHWYIIGTSRDSPDAARFDLRIRARQIGANAMMGVSYFKSRGSEAGTGRGIHHFTIHNFRAIPAVVGRATHEGGATFAALTGMSGNIKRCSEELARKRRVRRQWGIALIIGGVIAMGVGVVLVGLSIGAFMPGAVLLLFSSYCFKEKDVWLERIEGLPKAHKE